MSLFKNIFNKELTPEEIQKREDKANTKQRKKDETEKILKRFFGSDRTSNQITTFAVFKDTLEYLQNFMLKQEEKVLACIPAEYDKTQKREIKGILVATDKRLIFGLVNSKVQFTEELLYQKMKGTSLNDEGFTQKELFIDYGRFTKKYDDIKNNKEFKFFLSTLQQQIAIHKSSDNNSSNNNTPKNSNDKTADKYQQLQQLAILKEQGILTDQEFQQEKQKLLNS